VKSIPEEYKLGHDFVWTHELFETSEEDNACDKLRPYNPETLLKEYTETVGDDGTLSDGPKYTAIMAMFADQLHLVSREVFTAVMEEDLGKIWDKLNELEASFKKHRHALDKPYSEKPSW